MIRSAPSRRTTRRRSAPLPAAFVVVAALLASGVEAARAADLPRTIEKSGSVLVLPFDNLTGEPVPGDALRARLVGELSRRGVRVVADERMKAAMAELRLRTVSGVSDAMATALREKTGATSALVTAVDLYDPNDPPRIGLQSRVVRIAGARAEPVWVADIDLAGEETEGILGLGVVHDPAVLTGRAIESLAAGVLQHLRPAGSPETLKRPNAQARFDPRAVFVAPDAPRMGQGGALRVAILPFANRSKRPFAGDIVSLHFLREVMRLGTVQAIEPGRVRQVLLDTRLVQEPGISLPQADLVRDLLDADLVIAGTVYEYRDGLHAGTPSLEFSAYAIDARSRKVAWLVRSTNAGSDAVNFFEKGTVRTAPRLAGEMVRAILRQVVDRTAKRKK